MAITQRGTGWEILHSWWILLTFPMGLLSWAAFFYIWLRARKLKWLLSGLVYLGVLIALVWFTDKYPDAADRPKTLDNLITWGFFGSWLISVVQAFLSRKEFLIHLDARGQAGDVATEKMRTKVASQYGVEAHKVDKMLVEFDEDDYTVRLVRALFSVMPFAPDFVYYFNLEGAVRRVNPMADPGLAGRAAQLAQSPEVTQALKVTSAMDSIDKGLGIFTGAKNIYDHVKKTEGRRTFESDPQQAADAAIKALAMAYMIYNLFPGGVSQKISSFLELPAGKEMLLYYASAEIALPFTDNLVEAGGEAIGKLMNANREEAMNRFRQYSAGTPLDDVSGILDALTGQIAAVAGQVKMYVDPLTAKVNAALPGIMNAADSVTGAAATGVDLLPAWRFLGGRLAAEACVQRALREG